jgi:hypothetical protein
MALVRIVLVIILSLLYTGCSQEKEFNVREFLESRSTESVSAQTIDDLVYYILQRPMLEDFIEDMSQYSWVLVVQEKTFETRNNPMRVYIDPHAQIQIGATEMMWMDGLIHELLHVKHFDTVQFEGVSAHEKRVLAEERVMMQALEDHDGIRRPIRHFHYGKIM